MTRRAYKPSEPEDDGYDPPSGKIHTCEACGKQGIWQSPWQWFGSWKDWDDGERSKLFIACSQLCMDRREEVLEQRRIAADIEAAKTEEQRLEEALAKKRAWREKAERERVTQQQQVEAKS